MRELARREGQSGADIQLTVNSELQRYVQARLSGESAACVVIDCENGDLAAISSAPTYDPNLFIGGISSADYDPLLNSEYRPLVNKTVQGTYPPGSTFKMITAMAALEDGLIGPDDTVYCKGHLEVAERKFHCWKRAGHGWVDLGNSLKQSCDVYYYDLALKVGIEKISAMARRFGLGIKHDLALSSVASGLAPTKAWKRDTKGADWVIGDTVNASIGQGFMLASPMQLAVMSARIATGRAVDEDHPGQNAALVSAVAVVGEKCTEDEDCADNEICYDKECSPKYEDTIPGGPKGPNDPIPAGIDLGPSPVDAGDVDNGVEETSQIDVNGNPCNSVMKCPPETFCWFDGKTATCDDIVDDTLPGGDIVLTAEVDTSSTARPPDTAAEQEEAVGIAIVVNACSAVVCPDGARCILQRGVPICLAADLIDFPNPDTPLWWGLLAESGIGDRLKRCSKRRDVAPKQGSHCGGKEKICFFGNQDGCVGPSKGCYCDGRKGTQTWTCVEESTDCAITDVISPKCNICEVEARL